MKYLVCKYKRIIYKIFINSLIVLFFIICISKNIAIADYLGFEILHYTHHFSKNSIELVQQYPRKLDPDGVNIITPGLEVYLDQEIFYENVPIKFLRWTYAYYLDSMNLKAGYFHFGPRVSYILTNKFNLFFGLGPTFYFRESWNRFDKYRDDGFFQESDSFMRDYQFKILLAGDIDFQYFYSDEIQFVWSIIPGLPDIVSNATGFRIKW